MTDLVTAGGTTFAIGPRYDQAIAPMTSGPFQDVGMIASIGRLGVSSQTETFIDAETLLVTKAKSSFDYGEVNLVVALSPADSGHARMSEAALSEDSFAFRISLPQAEISFFFTGLVTADHLDGMSADGVVTRQYEIALGSEIRSEPV